jgi:hypothetical protein
MNAAFATRFPFEMFDNIGDVSLRPIDARLDKRIIKQPTGGTNERLAREIFFVAWLFADEHDCRALASFAEDSLRASFPKVAGFAIGRGRFEGRQG